MSVWGVGWEGSRACGEDDGRGHVHVVRVGGVMCMQ